MARGKTVVLVVALCAALAGVASARTLLGCPIAVGIRVGVDAEDDGPWTQGVVTLRNTGGSSYNIGTPTIQVSNPSVNMQLSCPGTTVSAGQTMMCGVKSTGVLSRNTRFTRNTTVAVNVPGCGFVTGNIIYDDDDNDGDWDGDDDWRDDDWDDNWEGDDNWDGGRWDDGDNGDWDDRK